MYEKNRAIVWILHHENLRIQKKVFFVLGIPSNKEGKKKESFDVLAGHLLVCSMKLGEMYEGLPSCYQKVYTHARPVRSVVIETDTAFTALLSRSSIPEILTTVGVFLPTTFFRREQ